MTTKCLGFRLDANYDAREVEDLMETLEIRGCRYRLKRDGLYHLYIPGDLDPEPFRLTLLDCQSVSWCEQMAWDVPIDFEQIPNHL